MNITYSTELMRNYKQSNMISPQKKFQAQQTNTGDTLLFSIGTDDVFYTSCKIANILDQTKWTLPLPVITNVNKISSFINTNNDANTIFYAANNMVNICVKSPMTSIWNTQKSHLAAPVSSQNIVQKKT